MTFLQPTTHKQVLIVRADLKMPVGKIAAQCCHASLALITNRGSFSMDDLEMIIPLTIEDAEWFSGEFTKTVLKVNSEQELNEIYDKALHNGLNVVKIVDNGRTVFNGVKTPTVVGIGPHTTDKFIGVTDHLKLL